MTKIVNLNKVVEHRKKLRLPKFSIPLYWPYKSWEAKKNAKKEELPVRKTEPFYPDFDNDVFAGVI
jgi:hypothetical protein